MELTDDLRQDAVELAEDALASAAALAGEAWGTGTSLAAGAKDTAVAMIEDARGKPKRSRTPRMLMIALVVLSAGALAFVVLRRKDAVPTVDDAAADDASLDGALDLTSQRNAEHDKAAG